jgi:hypothetical protein
VKFNRHGTFKSLNPLDFYSWFYWVQTSGAIKLNQLLKEKQFYFNREKTRDVGEERSMKTRSILATLKFNPNLWRDDRPLDQR